MVRPWFQFLVVQFLGVPLERVFLRWSGDYTLSVFSCSCKTSAGVVFTLERVCLHSSGGARAGRLALERVVLPEYKFWEGKFYARADWFSRSSGCALFLCLGARAGLIALEHVQILFLALERRVLRSSGSYVYELSAG